MGTFDSISAERVQFLNYSVDDDLGVFGIVNGRKPFLLDEYFEHSAHILYMCTEMAPLEVVVVQVL